MVLADAVVAVPSESQVHKQVVRKSVDLTGLVIDPQFSLFNVDVPKAVLGDSESIAELIGEAVARTHGVDVRTWSTVVLRAAHRAAANDEGSVTIAIDRDGEVGDRYRLLGLPVTYFIGRDGVIRSVYTGPFEEKQNDTNVQGAIEDSELDQRIAEILATEAAN